MDRVTDFESGGWGFDSLWGRYRIMGGLGYNLGSKSGGQIIDNYVSLFVDDNGSDESSQDTSL